MSVFGSKPTTRWSFALIDRCSMRRSWRRRRSWLVIAAGRWSGTKPTAMPATQREPRPPGATHDLFVGIGSAEAERVAVRRASRTMTRSTL
jgi:hypothetical protein